MKKQTPSARTSRWKPILLGGVLLGMLVASAGWYGAYTFFGPRHFEREAERALDRAVLSALECVLPAEDERELIGTFAERAVALPNLIVNPRGAGGRYLVISGSILLERASDREVLDEYMPLVHDRALRMLRGWSLNELSAGDAPTMVARELRRMIEDTAGVSVEEVIFQNFVLQ